MAKSNQTDYYSTYTDNDSGISYDLDYSSSNDLNSSTLTLIEPSSSYISQSSISSPRPPSPVPLPPTATIKKRLDGAQLIKFPSDGIIERTRPSTMRNSENGDFVVCHTNRGTYVAHRTPVVPEWVTRLVQEIESRQQ